MANETFKVSYWACNHCDCMVTLRPEDDPDQMLDRGLIKNCCSDITWIKIIVAGQDTFYPPEGARIYDRVEGHHE